MTDKMIIFSSSTRLAPLEEQNETSLISLLEKKGELPSTPDTLPETRAPLQANLFY
jgi:hypothetical protein